MSAILLNNQRRLQTKLGQFILIFILTGVSIGVALYLGDQPTIVGRFAVVGKMSLPEKQDDRFKLLPVAEKPSQAELMMGKYDGYLTKDATGAIKISAPKQAKLGEELSQWLAVDDSQVPIKEKPDNQTLSRVIGFLMMFLLMGALTFLVFIGEDREHQQLKRILVSPLSLPRYIISHCLYSFSLLFFPTLLLFALGQGVLQTDIGSSFATYSWLIGLICLLGISFAAMLMSLLPTSDTANMVGSAVVILTTIISGSFGQIGAQQGWLWQISNVFPQKSLLSLANLLEQGRVADGGWYLAHIIVISLSCLSLAIWGLKRETAK